MFVDVVLAIESVHETLVYEIKATEQYFPVVLFIILYKVVPLFVYILDEILKCNHSNVL